VQVYTAPFGKASKIRKDFDELEQQVTLPNGNYKTLPQGDKW